MKLTIGFYTEGLPFDGDTMYERALGGSETALACMARELACLGHRVKVFCRCERPGSYGAVEYFDASSLAEMKRLFDFDVWVVSRFAHALAFPVRAGLRVLWNHDVLTARNAPAMAGALAFCDIALFLSAFHERQWCREFPDVGALASRTFNGVDLDYIDAAVRRVQKEQDVFLYSSRPERGLAVLLTDIWPRVRERRANAELRVAGYDLTGMSVPREAAAHERAIADLAARTAGVKMIGPLSKKGLYRQMAAAAAVLYPTSFPEISCITALEAQAAGTPILTTDDFALTETVADSRLLVKGDPRSPEYQGVYIGRLFELLEDESLYQSVVARGRAHVEQGHRWSDVAARWEKLFVDFMARRSTKRRASVVKEQIRLGDLEGARQSAIALDVPALTEECDRRLAQAKADTTQDALFDANPDWARGDTRCAVVRSIVAEALEASGGDECCLLDVGCHNGAVSVDLSNTFEQLRVTGIDTNSAARTFAERYAGKQAKDPSRVAFRTAAIEDIAADEEKFDILFAGEVIEHVPDVRAFLEEIRDIVEPGGTVILTFPYGTSQVLWDGDRDAGHPKERLVKYPAHVRHFDYGDITDLFAGQRDFRMWRPTGQPGADGTEHGNTVVSFRTSSAPFGQRDPVRKRIATRPYESLAVCMIARNAEDDLARCLKSVSAVADEIHIHDTGSTDTTLEIARRFTDKITQGPFHDFGSARNAGIARARSNWILWIDADEVLLFADRVRKYLATRLYNGFVIRQNHLMIDVPRTFDQPVRLLRNFMGYRFTGLVHEHCEDVTKGPFDHAISPAMLLEDADIAHTGYLCESIRRQKCLRNFPLIMKDAEAHPERQLTKVLIARDMLNFTNWELEKHGTLTEQAVAWLRRAVAVHRENFADPADKYHEVSLAVYQRALELLGRAGVAAGDGDHAPPFEVELGLAAGYGGLQKSVKGARRWFADKNELMNHIAQKSLQLEAQLA